jgi:hypothetical protein
MQSRSNRRYFHGYSDRVLRERRRAARQALTCFPACGILLAVSVAAAGLGTWATWDQLRNDPTAQGGWGRGIAAIELAIIVGALLVVALVAVIFLAAMAWHACRFVWSVFARDPNRNARRIAAELKQVHVVPCFEHSLDLSWRGSAADHGYALAANCELLDVVAARCGVTAVSDLGINDDLDEKQAAWRPASEGTRTFAVLLAEVSKSAQHSDALSQDLKLMLEALRRAEEKGTGFCLALRTSDDLRVSPSGKLRRAITSEVRC